MTLNMSNKTQLIHIQNRLFSYQNPEPLNCEKRYLLLIEEFLGGVAEQLEDYEMESNLIEDVSYSSGVLKLEMAEGKVYVLNK